MRAKEHVIALYYLGEEGDEYEYSIYGPATVSLFNYRVLINPKIQFRLLIVN